ncbi:uncharacterized protein BDV14DRAFT_199564 [Aspergillus stella-maris]|uniref:uncharacterized protein n=1 Tax=Aspergillus stella-maris TaxID=1810926 RepID=UPI003CCE29C5
MSERLTSTLVTESTVINAPLDRIWYLIKLTNFTKFYTGLTKSEIIPAEDEGKDVVKWTFADGTVLLVREEEYSTVKHLISFHILKCEPWGLPYTSVLSTIRLYSITSRDAAGGTFVEWSGHYSADASAEVVQDGHIKRREALADLAKAAEEK